MRQPAGIVTGIAALLVAASVTVVVLRAVDSRVTSGQVASREPFIDVGAHEVERYEELRSMALAADAVVVGTIDSVTPGRTVRGGDPDDILRFASLNVRVTEVIAGDAAEVVSIQEDTASPDIEHMSKELTGQGGVFFLRAVTDLGDVVDEGAPVGPLYIVVSSQGLILRSSSPGARGRAVLPLWTGDGFRLNFAGATWLT